MADVDSKVVLNGEILDEDRACVPATSRGVKYGDGCFETLRAYNGQFLALGQHLKRLREGLEFLSIVSPNIVEKNEFTRQTDKLLKVNNLFKTEAVVRLQVWREGGRGYRSTSTQAGYVLTANTYDSPQSSLHLATVETKRTPSTAVPSSYKLSSGLNHIIAAKQAAVQGADDALVETVDGFVAETTIANIFWKRGNQVYTPSVGCDILPGVTRNIICHILNDRLGVELQESQFTVGDIKNADAVWVCNSLREIQQVIRIDDTRFNNESPFIQLLKNEFATYRKEQL